MAGIDKILLGGSTMLGVEDEEARKKIEQLENPEFSDTGNITGIASFPDFLATVKSKMDIFGFFRDFAAGMKFVLHAGQIVNNCVSDRADLPLAAKQGKELMDLLTKLNSDLNSRLSFGSYTKELKNFPIKPRQTPEWQTIIEDIGSINPNSFGLIIIVIDNYNLSNSNISTEKPGLENYRIMSTASFPSSSVLARRMIGVTFERAINGNVGTATYIATYHNISNDIVPLYLELNVRTDVSEAYGTYDADIHVTHFHTY